jgi:hypothetical protein
VLTIKLKGGKTLHVTEESTRFVVETTSGYRATLPACICDREPCPRVTIGIAGRRRHPETKCRRMCHGWHAPVVRKFAEAVAKTYR